MSLLDLIHLKGQDLLLYGIKSIRRKTKKLTIVQHSIQKTECHEGCVCESYKINIPIYTIDADNAKELTKNLSKYDKIHFSNFGKLLSKKDKDENTLLHYAVKHLDYNSCRWLIKYFPETLKYYNTMTKVSFFIPNSLSCVSLTSDGAFINKSCAF